MKADKSPLRVMGIDPGLADVGWGVVDWPGSGNSSLVDYGVVRTPSTEDLAPRLATIHRELSEIIDATRPDVVAIEELFFCKNVKTAMVVAHGRAACVLATAHRRLPMFEYTPLQIKQALTGHGGASKSQVQLMVRVVLGLKDIPRPDHAADALAAALCYVHSLGMNEKINRARDAGAVPEGEAMTDARKALLAASQSRRPRRRR